MDKVIQGSRTTHSSGKPVPLAVADLQAVMFTGAVGAVGYLNKLTRLIVPQIGQQVHFLCFGDFFRCCISHAITVLCP